MLEKKRIIELCENIERVIAIFQNHNHNPNVLYFTELRSIPLFLMESLDLRKDVKDVVPIQNQSELYQSVRYLHEKSSSYSTNEFNEILWHLQKVKSIFEIVLKNLSPGRKGNKIFYSWQSDLPSNSNRGFIRTAIEKAVLETQSDEEIDIDSDTQRVPGSPDIINSILEKIDKSSIFIADVSLVYSDPVRDFHFPNPNVLYELGYAMKSLGSQKIVMVFNTHFGEVSKLPFDLGFKRQLIYSCAPEDSDKSQNKRLLSTGIKNAIQTILNSKE